ncbi:MAG: SRPBCC domain-containing protein [Nannocystaceae bacterium]|nr:SRPBCC domain-containing protein [bacterium]
MTIKHDTLTFTRTLKHPPARVFRAFTTNAELEKWSPPDEGMNMTILEGTCEPGGRLVWTCGPGDAEGVRVVSDYFHVAQDTAVLFSEAVYMRDDVLSVALVTVSLSGSTETTLEICAQVSALDPEMAEGYGHGWNAALANLEALLG